MEGCTSAGSPQKSVCNTYLVVPLFLMEVFGVLIGKKGKTMAHREAETLCCCQEKASGCQDTSLGDHRELALAEMTRYLEVSFT